MAVKTIETFSTLAETTTTSSVDALTSTVTLPVSSRTLFPQTGQFRIVVQDSATDSTNREVMLVTAGHGTGAGSFTVTREVEGPTASAHASGSYVAQVLTADAVERWAPSYLWQPRHHKMLAWSFDPFSSWSNTGLPLTAGVAAYVKVPVPEDMSVTNIIVGIVIAGVTLTNCYAGLYSTSTGGTGTATQLGVTADQSAVWTSTGWKSMALASGPFDVTGGPDEFVYVGLLVGSAGTMAQFQKNYTGIAALGTNLPTLSASDGYRYGIAGSGLTALPATVAVSTFAASNSVAWVGLS